MNAQKYQRVVDRVAYYKNLRSALDAIEYYDAGGTAMLHAAVRAGGASIADGAAAE